MSKSAKSKVKLANRQDDPLSNISCKDNFTDLTTNYDFECRRFRELPPTIKTWAFELLSSNMKTMYEQSNWDWNPKAKMAELDSPKAWCLLARRRPKESDDNSVSTTNMGTNDRLVGFVHFRYDLDYGLSVVYCYEIHVELSERRRGLGRQFLSILRLLAQAAGMVKVVATVFKNNQPSLELFRRNGFEEDDTNPEDDEEADYVILSTKITMA